MASTTDALTRRPLRPRFAESTTWRVRLTGHRLAIAVVLLLALAFYVWTAYTASPFTFSSHNNDVYNLLTTAFLHGHTYLPLDVPAGLLHLRDPYDPAQNAPYQAAFHDLSYYGGRLYSPWGPTPVLTLFLPFRITGLHMSPSFAVALYAFIGFVCAVAIMHVLIRRFIPQTPNWLLVVATVALALTNAAPFLLRRPAQYEVAISAGYCFAMAGILLAVMAALGSAATTRRRLALSSLCLGVAVGARLPLLPLVLVAVAAALVMVRRGGNRRALLMAALGPFLVCLVLLAFYNVARFGSPGNFGAQYELAGVNQMTMPMQRLAYVPPGMFSYLLMPPRVAVTFPHVFLMTTAEYPGPFPKGYAGAPGVPWPAEPAGGMLPTMPITLLLLTLPFLWRRRRPGEQPVLLLATGAVVLTLAIMFLLAYAVFGTTERYEVDYATVALIGAVLVWALLLARQSQRNARRRLLVVSGVVLCAFGAAVGTAISFTGYYDSLRQTNPGVFNTLEDVTSPFVTVATMVADKAVIARVDGPLPTELPPPGFGTVDENGAGTWLGAGPVSVNVLSPSAQDLALTAGQQVGPGAPPPSRLAISVKSPGHPPITVPLIGHVVRLPVHLHWGLNRIVLGLAGPRGAYPTELHLDHLALSR
jgi:hypothetical protein